MSKMLAIALANRCGLQLFIIAPQTAAQSTTTCSYNSCLSPARPTGGSRWSTLRSASQPTKQTAKQTKTVATAQVNIYITVKQRNDSDQGEMIRKSTKERPEEALTQGK